MKRCKFCNEVIDVVGTTFCPICGNNLDAEPKKTNKKKIKPVPELNREFSNEKVGSQDVRVVTGKKMEETKVKSGVRKSYIFFGILALIVGALLCATSIYRVFAIWEVTALFESTYEISNNLIGSALAEAAKTAEVLDAGSFLFSTVLLLFAFLSIIGTFFSFFHKKQTLSSVFAKLSAMLGLLVVLVHSYLSMFLLMTDPSLLEALDIILEKHELITKIGAFGSLGCFVLTIIFAFVDKGKAYRATSYKGLRAFVWTAFAVLVYISMYTSVKQTDLLVKVYSTLYYGLPAFLVIGALLMFGGAKYRGE